jgi:hypothetical protein
MSRPPLEVADIVRCAGQSFLERSRKRITGSIKKCCWPESGMDVLVLKTGAFGGLLTGRPEDLGVTG